MTSSTKTLKIVSLVLASFMFTGCATLQSAYDSTVDTAKSVYNTTAGTVSGWVNPDAKK